MHFILNYFKMLSIRLKRASYARRTYRELNNLSNAELKDIGICRGGIRAISEEILHDNYTTSNRNLEGWV